MIFSGINSYLLGGLVIVSLLFAGYGYWSYNELLKKDSKITTLQIENDSKDKQLEQNKVDIKKIQDINRDLSSLERLNAKQLDELSRKLNDIGEFALEQPEAIQDLINQASIRRIRCFALASGAIPKENEDNKTCPHLIKNTNNG